MTKGINQTVECYEFEVLKQYLGDCTINLTVPD